MRISRITFAPLLLGLAGVGVLTPEPAAAMDARVLPKGRFRFSVIHGRSAGISNIFNGAGDVESIVAPYEIELSAKNFKEVLPEVRMLVDYLDTFGNYRYDFRQRGTDTHGVVQSDDGSLPTLGDAVNRGFLDLDVEAKRRQYHFALMYGLTDTTSVGIVVPYVQQDIRVKAAIGGANTAEDIYQGFTPLHGAAPEVQAGLDLARKVDTEFLQNLLVDGGYGRVQSRDDSGLGDILLGGRHLYLNTRSQRGEWLGAAQFGVQLPTGRVFDPSDLVAQDLGDGAWALSGTNVINFNPAPLVSLSNTINYTFRLPGSRAYRVPRLGDPSPIPDASSEMRVNEHLGYKFWVTVGGRIRPTSYLTLNANYEWYWKGKDGYSGSDPTRDYAFLAARTNRYLETLQLGLSLSSIQPFLKGDFPIPLDFAFDHYVPLRGRNNPVAAFSVFELSFYF